MKTKELKEQLFHLLSTIETGNVPKAQADWGGADVAVVKSEPKPKPDSYYPDPKYVVTKHHLELSWLMEEITGIFRGQLDYISKYAFYDRLADSAIDQTRSRGDNMQEVLKAVVKEAINMADEA